MSKPLKSISAGLCGGGIITIKTPIPGKHIFQARMDWDDGDSAVGSISTTIHDALENLEVESQKLEDRVNDFEHAEQ